LNHDPADNARLLLPGPRTLWWTVAALAICLPLGLLLARGMADQPPTAAAIDFETRKLNLVWRLTRATLLTEPGGTSSAAESRQAGRKLYEETRLGHQEAIKQLYERALESEATTAKPVSPRTANATELVIAHALATEQDKLARELFARQDNPSADLRVAMSSATELADPPTPEQKRKLLAASETAASSRYGEAWSPFTRDRIRARLHITAGRLDRSREVHGRLHASEDTVLSIARTLWLALLFAGLFGLFSCVAIAVRALARPAGSGPRLGWLRARYPGLGNQKAYHPDLLVPVLGFASWLVGYLLAGTLVSLMPAARAPGGLAVLFQSTAGVMLAWAVISAFSRVDPPIDAARFLGGSEVGAWRASTASLWSYCALLPLMLPAILISQALGGGEPEGHPVVEMLIDGPEAIQLAALGLAVVVVTPIGEELLFRGFLYRALRQRLGVGRALAITSALFALLHMAPTQLVPYAMLGLVFGLVFEWVGSLWAAIILHGLWNAVVFAGIVLVALS